jgi:hypothetical protein
VEDTKQCKDTQLEKGNDMRGMHDVGCEMTEFEMSFDMLLFTHPQSSFCMFCVGLSLLGSRRFPQRASVPPPYTSQYTENPCEMSANSETSLAAQVRRVGHGPLPSHIR